MPELARWFCEVLEDPISRGSIDAFERPLGESDLEPTDAVLWFLLAGRALLEGSSAEIAIGWSALLSLFSLNLSAGLQVRGDRSMRLARM